MAERWWEDFDGSRSASSSMSTRSPTSAGPPSSSSRTSSLLCVDFMSSDHAGHLGWNRLDPEHPAHDPARAGDELIRVYEAIDRAAPS